LTQNNVKMLFYFNFQLIHKIPALLEALEIKTTTRKSMKELVIQPFSTILPGKHESQWLGKLIPNLPESKHLFLI